MDGDNPDGELLPCPFCGNPEPKLMDAYFDRETQYYVNCGCCNLTMHPDSKEAAFRNWNERTAYTEAE
ncbi:restriction alleviation protein, Lar family [Erwinia psidii]|nr:restriction alleviation protein, Lar family [Erwinia psidii]